MILSHIAGATKDRADAQTVHRFELGKLPFRRPSRYDGRMREVPCADAIWDRQGSEVVDLAGVLPIGAPMCTQALVSSVSACRLEIGNAVFEKRTAPSRVFSRSAGSGAYIKATVGFEKCVRRPARSRRASSACSARAGNPQVRTCSASSAICKSRWAFSCT
jgi:hypothetical protein